MRLHVSALSVCLLAGAVLAQDTSGTGSIAGVVRGVPPNEIVKACLAGRERCAFTDDKGIFRFDGVRAGEYRVELTIPGRESAMAADVVVRAGLEASVEIVVPTLEALQQSITVSESVYVAPEEVKNSGYLVDPGIIFKSAAALQDVSRYVQTLPGVAIGTQDFRNDIIVRGGSPLENLYIVDNIEIPNINAFANFASAGGTVSLLDTQLLQDVTFLTGGYPAPYINRTSGVLQVTQREGDREQFRGRATLGFAGAGGILEGPIRKERGSWIVSARRSFLDFFTDDLGFGGVPVAYSFNAKALYDLSPRDRIWAVNVSGVDRIRLGLTEGKKELEEVDNFDIRYEGWRSATGFNWQRLFGASGVGILGLTHSEARIGSTVKDLVRNGLPPAGANVDDIIAAGPVVFREDSREGETTLKYDLTTYTSVLGKAQAGGSFKVFQVNYDTASPFGNDSPYATTPGVNPFILRRNFTANQTGGYLQSTRNLGSRLNVTWGARLDNFNYIGQTRFSPRGGLSFRLTDRLSWRASYGSYYQQPFLLFLSAFDVNRGLVPQRADHYVTGFAITPNSSLRITVEAYRKNYKDYPVSLQFPSLSLINIGDTFNVRDILFPLTSAGRGRVDGLELLIEKRFTTKWYGQANFALAKGRHAGLDGIRRPGSFDYPRIANLTGGYRLNAKWEFSMRASYLAGRPYTPFDLPMSTAQRRAIFDLSRVNAERLPDYIRLDVRADRTFTIRDRKLLVFIGAQNLLNRTNVAGYTWNRRSNTIQVGDQLGLFPNIGLEWRF